MKQSGRDAHLFFFFFLNRGTRTFDSDDKKGVNYSKKIIGKCNTIKKKSSATLKKAQLYQPATFFDSDD